MPPWLPGLLIALVGIIPGVLVWFQADQVRKDTKAKASKDDVRKAFDQAKRMYESGISEAERQITNCTKRIAELEDDLEAARGREKGLRLRVSRLEDALRRAGLAIPNGTDVL